MDTSGHAAGPTALLTRAEAAYQFAVADPAAAAPVTEALVIEARRTGDVEAEVLALRAQAWCVVRAELAEQRGRRLLNRAARLAEAARLDERLAEVLLVRSAVNEELGATRAAERDLLRARDLLGDKVPPGLEQQTAVLHQNAGRIAEAAAIYRRALRRRDLPVDIRGKMTNNLALIEAQLGRYGVALALAGQARALAEQIGPFATAIFTESEAWVLAHAGRLPESLALFEESERLFEVADLPLGELHADAADAFLDLRLLPEARSAADRAVREFSDTDVPLMRAEAQLRVARVALSEGDAEGASKASREAVEAFRQQQRVGWAWRAAVVGIEARLEAGTVTHTDLRDARRAAATLERLGMTVEAVDAHLTAGRAASRLGRDAWARESFEHAHELARGSSMLTRLRGRLAAASAAALRDEPALVVRHCRQGLEDLERHRGQLASTELRVLASAHGVELGQLALRALRGTSSAVKVFDWMERNRATALLSVQRAGVDGFAEEFERLREMRSEIDASGASEALVARHAALEQRLRRLTWGSSNGRKHARTRRVPTRELQALLGDRVLVEYGVLDGEVFAAVVTADQVTVSTVAPVAVLREERDRLAFALRTLARLVGRDARPERARLARERVAGLRRLLVEPLALPPDREVVVVPVDFLQSVPWSALVDAPVSLSPSASFWAGARQRPRPASGKVLLAAGPGLSAAEDEVRRLGLRHDDSVVLVPPDSTVRRVADELDGATTAHFACHGVVRADNPMFSGLRLSDGLLTVQELELRDLAPYRVVLAACEASADIAYTGGELLGFVSALVARGTAGVLGSIQLVPDEAAAGFMVRVHEELHGEATLASALHAARGSLDLDDPADLVNWCGFTAYGAA
ncbi:MAG TPA: CHAT domain-containing tetratricopeptide repeat protein [Nocardioides sp.]|uniref:CHAT domain-containing protein n=1 Tax=Nocardioides sp. TaxID=35761 RepID=UPI002E308630|nr:CHAT domain-containing tetratricopeptide repeat protein [Nocardioides sp.]HEX5087703.1 CHAT domain-containing tetratricopeptide repeat protein [Nocardioides sp.]